MGRGAAAPNSAVLIRSTATGIPASRKISTAKSCQVVCAPIGQMIQTLSAALEQKQNSATHLLHRAGRAVLVVDHAHPASLGTEAEHRFDKVRPARAVQPAGPHDHMPWAAPGGDLARQLRLGIHAARRRLVGFDQRPPRSGPAGEHVIGAHLNQRRFHRLARAGHGFDRFGVDSVAGRGVALGPIHLRVGGAVDHGRRAERDDPAFDRVELRQIQLCAASSRWQLVPAVGTGPGPVVRRRR